MSKSVNRVTLIATLGSDPALKYTGTGIPVASFTAATNEEWKDDQGNKQQKTQWHKLVIWRKLGEIAAQYMKKGQTHYFEGKIEYREYTAKDGTKRYTTEIIVDNMVMLGSKEGGNSSNYSRSENASSTSTPREDNRAKPSADPGPGMDFDDDEVPF